MYGPRYERTKDKGWGSTPETGVEPNPASRITMGQSSSVNVMNWPDPIKNTKAPFAGPESNTVTELNEAGEQAVTKEKQAATEGDKSKDNESLLAVLKKINKALDDKEKEKGTANNQGGDTSEITGTLDLINKGEILLKVQPDGSVSQTEARKASDQVLAQVAGEYSKLRDLVNKTVNEVGIGNGGDNIGAV